MLRAAFTRGALAHSRASVRAFMADPLAELPKFEVLKVTAPASGVVQVSINNGSVNPMSMKMWREFTTCFKALSITPACRAIVVSAENRMFTAGLDLKEAGMILVDPKGDDVARKTFWLRHLIMDMQASFTAIEECRQPVIAAVHNGCIGAGVDLITAADIRVCSEDAYFVVAEVDIGLAADVGTLQRLPRVIGSDSLVRELAYTGRKLTSQEAETRGLVSFRKADREKTIEAAIAMATTIAAKSPVAVAGSKRMLNYSRDHTVADGLEYAATWNQAMLQTQDIIESMGAKMAKRPPSFADLSKPGLDQ